MAEKQHQEVHRSLQTRHLSMIALGGSICPFQVRFPRMPRSLLTRHLDLRWAGITGSTGQSR